MDKKTYLKKDLELASQIQDYQDDTNSKEIEIAVNKKVIDRLNFERFRLRAMYETIDEAPQRNLQGEIIKKEK